MTGPDGVDDYMKILFIYPDILLHRHDWTGYYYTGIALLSAVLKEHGHETSLFHIIKPVGMSDFMNRIEKEGADLIAFSSTSPMFSLVREFASWLDRAGMKIPAICGGIHPTIAPDEAIATAGIDMICRGEGEAPLLELCMKMENKEDISSIENLWIKKNGDIIKKPLRPLIEDLDTLPFPDHTIFSYPTLFHAIDGGGMFMASRGCPYNCTYCCNHLLRKIYGGNGSPVRFRSVDNLIKDIKQVIEHYPSINKLYFDDDILFLKRAWSEEFAEKYSREIHIPFVCNARVNVTDEALVKLLVKAGCTHVKFGLESGNEDISNKVLNRNLTNDSIKKVFALCKKAGLITESFNMVGIPYDTPGTILDTIKLNASIGVDKMQVSIYQPYQGTRLADLCREKKFMASGDLNSDWCSPVLKLDSISGPHVLMFRDYFKVMVRYYQLLQSLPSGASKLFMKISDRMLSSPAVSTGLNLVYIPLNYLYRRMLTLRVKAKTAGNKTGKHLLKASKSPG
jgi:radical SAM superfamily enzyme YgiQ (UPF0313 family)